LLIGATSGISVEAADRPGELRLLSRLSSSCHPDTSTCCSSLTSMAHLMSASSYRWRYDRSAPPTVPEPRVGSCETLMRLRQKRDGSSDRPLEHVLSTTHSRPATFAYTMSTTRGASPLLVCDCAVHPPCRSIQPSAPLRAAHESFLDPMHDILLDVPSEGASSPPFPAIIPASPPYSSYPSSYSACWVL
jgi:hypothetical protein